MKTHPSFLNLFRSTGLALGAAVALFAGAAASTASAALIITVDGTAPTEGIYKSNPLTGTAGNINFYWRGVPSPDQVKTAGQGLSTAGAQTSLSLSAVTFQIFGFDTAVQGMSLQLSIYEASLANTTPSTATLLSTQAGTLPTLQKNGYLTLTLDMPVVLQPNKYYSFICSFTEPTSTDGSAKYLGFSTIGSGISNTDSSWRWIGTDGVYDTSSGNNKNGFVFYAHATPIPEPGAYVLLTGALVGLGIRRRLRNS